MTKEIREALENLLTLMRYDMDITNEREQLANEVKALSDDDLKEIVCDFIMELR